jgi:hypothetical protein
MYCSRIALLMINGFVKFTLLLLIDSTGNVNGPNRTAEAMMVRRD